MKKVEALIEEGIPLAQAVRRINRPVHTEADLLERCDVCPDTGCWEWRGVMGNKGKTPVLVHKGRQISARVLARMLAGLPIREKHRTLSGAQCSVRCINPAHTRHLSMSNVIRATMLRNGKQAPNHRAAIVAALRRRAPTLIGSVERGDDIRRRVQAGERRDALAAEFGCSVANIGRVARGKGWASTTLPAASVFSWGGA